MKWEKNRTLAACLIVFINGAAFAQDTSTIKPLPSIKFSGDQDVKCLQAAIETGDPKSGRSKASPGGIVSWHYHTAEEQLMLIRGPVVAEMTDHRPTRLGSGGFAVMAGRMAHQFSCQAKSGCLMIVVFDRAYDIFWGKGD